MYPFPTHSIKSYYQYHFGRKLNESMQQKMERKKNEEGKVNKKKQKEAPKDEVEQPKESVEKSEVENLKPVVQEPPKFKTDHGFWY